MLPTWWVVGPLRRNSEVRCCTSLRCTTTKNPRNCSHAIHCIATSSWRYATTSHHTCLILTILMLSIPLRFALPILTIIYHLSPSISSIAFPGDGTRNRPCVVPRSPESHADVRYQRRQRFQQQPIGCTSWRLFVAQCSIY